jgi:energy-coupling factor transporter ATP-binding protein EcfA2
MSNVPNYYLKLKKKVKKAKHHNPNHEKGALKHPCMVVIAGKTGSGKTNALMNIIDIGKNFSKVYVYTKDTEEELYDLVKKSFDTSLLITNDINDLPSMTGDPDYISLQEEDDEGNLFDSSQQNLLIFDDFQTDSPKIRKRIESYFCRGRKQNISCICLAQNYYAINKNIRGNINYLLLTASPSAKNDLKILMGQMHLDPQIMVVYNDNVKKFPDYMTLSFDEPDRFCRIGLTEVIEI